MPLNCPTITLAECRDMFCIINGIDKRKFGKDYLFIFGEVWKDIFQQTLFSTKKVYVELKKGSPFNYVNIPTDSQRFFGLAVEDKCNKLKPLFYNDKINTLIKPKAKTCGCSCNCGGLCETVGSLVPTTQVVNIDGTDYTNTTWIKNCNGDVMEYRTIWTKQFTFNRGSYDPSYDFSYEIGTSNSEIVQINLSRKLCDLDLLPCGCPAQTPENENTFFDHCGNFINPFCSTKKQCEKHWGDCNYYSGECVMSECGSKVFVKHVDNFAANNQWLVMTYQTNGINPDGQTNVPDYAKMALFTGVYYYKNLFNDRINPRIKEAQKYSYIDEQNKIILYNNKFAIEDFEAMPQMANW